MNRGKNGRSGRLACAWPPLLALLCALALPLLAAPVAPVARADGVSVTYEQRDYTVDIQANGDTRFIEHWQVHFAGQSFHHAFLRLYLARTAGIDFGAISGATSGSQQVTQTTDEAGNPMRQVAWDFPPAQDADRAFDIPYTVHGALGLNANWAWLDWHFLDGGSQTDFAVSESQIRLSVPAAGMSNLQMYATSGNNGNGGLLINQDADQPALVSGQHLTANSPLEAEAVFPRAALDANVQRQPWQTNDEPPTPPTPRIDAPFSPGGTSTTPSQPVYTNSGYTIAPTSPGVPIFGGIFNLFRDVCAGLFAPVLLLGFIFTMLAGGHRAGGGAWPRRGPWMGGPWSRGPWMGGPWNNGGGGFGGGMGGGSGGMGGGGGGGGGGASGFS